jgi:hypothetical protein
MWGRLAALFRRAKERNQAPNDTSYRLGCLLFRRQGAYGCRELLTRGAGDHLGKSEVFLIVYRHPLPRLGPGAPFRPSNHPVHVGR